jgi:phenylpropionate dioxygenase-like ring-hydroxylating dioxygenase large terminal subunit
MKSIKWKKEHFISNEILNKEIKTFFSPTSFIGLTQLLKNKDFYPVDFLSKRYLISKTDQYNLLNNVCLHKNARIVDDGSEIKNKCLVCPIHYWTYNTEGDLIISPSCDDDDFKKGKNIKKKNKIFESKNFLFTNENLSNEIKDSKFLKDFDFSNYKLISIESQTFDGNWKEYGIVFNDSNHVQYFHPEMKDVVDSNSIEWEITENYSAHRMKYKKSWETKKENRFVKYFKMIQDMGIELKNDGRNDYAVTWFNIFPNVFIDLWVGQIMIGFIEPISIDQYKLHNIWLCDEKLIDEHELNEVFSSMFEQVDIEDDIISKRIHSGIINNFDNDTILEYVISPSESGGVDFHSWLFKNGTFYN